MMTSEKLGFLRRNEVRNRLLLRRMWVGVAIALVVVPLAVLLDLGGTPIIGTDAVVAAKVDRWTLKRGDQCTTSLETPLGETSISDFGRCARRSWSVGDHVKIAAKVGRITGSIKVMRDYGVFALPRMNTAGGLDIFSTPDYTSHPPKPLNNVQQDH